MMNVRTMKNGNMFLPKSHKETEEMMDSKYLRHGKDLIWYPHSKDPNHLVDDNIFSHKPCYIVGKGPSLDKIDGGYFLPRNPIICINESIHVIERLGLASPLYCIQQDVGLKGSCRPINAKMWVSYEAKDYYLDYSNKNIFMVEDYGSHGMYTSMLAIEMAQRFGATRLEMLGFDACVCGDVTYAESIERSLVGDGTRFIKACIMMKQVAKIPISFIGIH